MARQKGHYHTYAELTALLEGWRDRWPSLCQLESIGQSVEGRELWLLTITDQATGNHASKPAFWVEANTHAGEVTGTEAALHFVDTLLAQHADGDYATAQLLRTSTIYALPRISVDGAELYLTTPFSVRSSPLIFPGAEHVPGLVPRDIDGNGELLVMRVADPAGGFKESDEDPRIMVPREPHEYEESATYYRLLPEGVFQDWDGFTQNGRLDNHDLNRQFPTSWTPGGGMTMSQQDGGTPGAGPYPMYLREARYVVEAISARNNICAMLTHHVSGTPVLVSRLRAGKAVSCFRAAVIPRLISIANLSRCAKHKHEPNNRWLRQTTGRILIMAGGAEVKAEDMGRYDALNTLGESLTGYNVTNKEGTPGPMTVDWAYHHRGIMAWLPEIWNLQHEVGLVEVREAFPFLCGPF
jgi:hypothetical protein